MVKVIECVKAHYEIQDVEMGKVYRWCPESVVIECDCGERLPLTASRTACGGCGADHAATAEEVLTPARRIRSITLGALCAHTTRPPGVPKEAAQETHAMPSGRRGSLRARGTSPEVIACDHDYPMLATPTETGRYYARCLACLAVGPERPSSDTARKALRVLGAADSSGNVQRRTPSARAQKSLANYE